MPGRIEKTVFISYRRTNVPWALAIYQELTHHGYDVFFDYLSIPSGDFEKVILENIKARAHFLIVLTPSALERCKEPGDWLRREIEAAMDEKRNIVPLMLESFDFGSPLVTGALTGKLASLKNYNGLKVYSEYFFEAMDKLRERYLNVAVSDIPLPVITNVETQAVTKSLKLTASEAAKIEKEELTAQEWFERGFVFTENRIFEEAIRCYSEAIRLKKDLAEAYINRGAVRGELGDLKREMADYDIAISLNPNFYEAFYNRGIARMKMESTDKALDDLNMAIHLRPDSAITYNYRGLVYLERGEIDDAMSDFNTAINLQPDYVDAYLHRGIARAGKGELDSAIADYNVVLRFKPDDSIAFNNRGALLSQKGDNEGAIRDLNEAIRLKPDYANAYSNRASVHRAKGNLDSAIMDFSEAIRLTPNNPNIYYMRGDLWQQKKDYASAIADYHKYLDLRNDVQDGEVEEVRRILYDLKMKVK